MSCLVHAFLRSGDLDDIRGVVRTGNADLGGRLHLDAFQLDSLFAQNVLVVLLGDLEVDVGLGTRRGRGVGG